MNRIIIITILLIGSWSCTKVPYFAPEPSSTYELQFSNLATMKSEKYGMGYTTDGKYLYAVYGNSSNPHYVTKSTRYNMATDKWSNFPNNKTTKRFISAEYVGDKIYVFNGHNQDGSFNRKVELIDPHTGEISYLNDNPSPTCNAGTAVWKEKILVFGGLFSEHVHVLSDVTFTKSGLIISPSRNINIYSNQLYLFDPDNDSWTLLGVIPEHKQTRGEIVEGILYVFGGFNGKVSSQIDAYDIADRTWSYLGNMPIGISANAITKHGDFIWLVGDSNKLSLLAVFNTKTLEIHYIKSNMLGRKHAGAEIIGNKLYVFGGNRTSAGDALSSIQVADISEIETLLTETAANYNNDEGKK
jgi:hypothetical protein